MKLRPAVLALAALSATALQPLAPAAAQDCTITVGSVLSLTGPAGRFGQAAAKSVELAFQDLNEAGGAAGCRIVADVRDAQSQGTVAVDAARQLVDLQKVPVIIGGDISSVSIPIVTAVTGPAAVVQVSPVSTSPTLTTLAKEGKTGGIFFRTITSDALQGTAAAKYAIDQGLKKLAIVHVNNDFGVNMVAEFQKVFARLGGEVTSVTPYNQNQASYQPEVTAALDGDPEALYLVAYPGDGTTIARTWIAQGGPAKFLLNDGMNSADFIQDVGPQYLDDAFGTSSGTTATPSTDYFCEAYNSFAKEFDCQAPAADRAYDAAAIVGLAVAIAGEPDKALIKAAIPKAVDPAGETVHAGPDGFKKALALIAEGKPIRYEGVTGPVQFDQYGDITGPFRLWRIQNGEVTTIGEMGAEEVGQLKAEADQ
ncbi:MAG TPA: ABC transporter substrate-binding protein [Geminicoccus sp.]|uniref:ABC transporter substrate-binding protein n=1 Tax=Geminicoccus sp. TaxID=2024832 RepID=UPI002C82ED19|nr:ABC transporter substrate-binding protein [Geminicoccus sp.]HWL71662.1 ABC transporter substrate-binding protein [Geminicoccus sp.]